MDKLYGKTIWTNHALQRLKERGISQSDAWATWRRPQESKYAASKGAWVFHRIYGKQRIEVVAKKNERQEWVILSVWSKEVKRELKNESFLSFLVKKIFKKKK
ncbi:MAG: DUF4258 domain-containing protein [Patescibacteria group bacterium]